MASPQDSTDGNKHDPVMAEAPAEEAAEVVQEAVVLDPIEQLQAELAAALAQVAEQKIKPCAPTQRWKTFAVAPKKRSLRHGSLALSRSLRA